MSRSTRLLIVGVLFVVTGTLVRRAGRAFELRQRDWHRGSGSRSFTVSGVILSRPDESPRHPSGQSSWRWARTHVHCFS